MDYETDLAQPHLLMRFRLLEAYSNVRFLNRFTYHLLFNFRNDLLIHHLPLNFVLLHHQLDIQIIIINPIIIIMLIGGCHLDLLLIGEDLRRFLLLLLILIKKEDIDLDLDLQLVLLDVGLVVVVVVRAGILRLR